MYREKKTALNFTDFLFFFVTRNHTITSFKDRWTSMCFLAFSPALSQTFLSKALSTFFSQMHQRRWASQLKESLLHPGSVFASHSLERSLSYSPDFSIFRNV